MHHISICFGSTAIPPCSIGLQVTKQLPERPSEGPARATPEQVQGGETAKDQRDGHCAPLLQKSYMNALRLPPVAT
ncbi:hypothetical protein EYF80_032140 [Liparis tanakae]|uniref:Uncharacterized protein n=1 Tax=Liparis tanakae TaxID=230148 RepID=A0A4Z2GVS4_9TELE|nr:hypothetical protein EYF80_032140 [Liparis tanakae]